MEEVLGLLAIGGLVLLGVTVWQRRRRDMMYDLRFWNDEPSPEPDEGEIHAEGGPYCHLCDHPNPPGTYFCHSCGQKIA